MTTKEFISKYDPCLEAVNAYATKYDTMAEVWDNCKRPDWLFWICKKHTPLEKEQSVELAIAFAEPIPDHTEVSLSAIQAAKDWLADPTEEKRLAAAAAACSAAAAAWSAAAWSAWSAGAEAAEAAAAGAGAAGANCDIFRSLIPNPFKS